jgi:hypothetical protein
MSHEISTELLASLPEAIQKDALDWEKRFIPLEAQKKGRVAALQALADKHDVPFKTVAKKFYRYLECGFAGLIDRRAAGPEFWNVEERIGLSHADQELVKTYCERYQRNNEAALDALRRAWKKGEVETDKPLDVQTGYPRGWSKRNLARYAPSEFELKAAREGRSAAAGHRPLVYTTRRDLYVGQYFLYDDIWHDHEVNLLATQQRGRPLEFHGLDLASGYKHCWGVRVRREVDGVHESLKTADFRFLLAGSLFTDGYHPRGTTIVLEHGTTTIPEELQWLITRATNGAIKFELGGMQGAAAHAGQYAGRSKGNFRIKAALESLGNLIHNELAYLPGQTGKDRQHCPEEQHGLRKHNDALLLALSQLPPERIEWIQWPLCSLQQFKVVLQELYARINARTEHDLEGWDERYVPDRATGRMRRMSPAEFWNQGRRALQTISPETAALIIGTANGKERQIRNGMIELKNSEISGDPLRFDAHQLPPRGKYLTVLNPFDTRRLTCFDAKGRYVATLDRLQSVCRSNVQALHESCGRAAKIEAEMLAPLRRRAMGQAQKKRAMHLNNARAIDLTKPFTAEEKAISTRDRTRLRAERGSIEDLMPPPQLDPAEASPPDEADDDGEGLAALYSTGPNHAENTYRAEDFA